MEAADPTNSTATWLAIVVMILHWAGPIVKSWSDAAIARWLAKSPDAQASLKQSRDGK